MSKVLYSAVVLDSKSKEDLIRFFRPIITENDEILCHHMTINLGEIDPQYADALGRNVELTAYDYAFDDKVMAVGVKGFPTKNKKAHITVLVNRRNGGKPKMSNDLTNWNPIGIEIKLHGVVTEVKQ
jgi:hypothetical protein